MSKLAVQRCNKLTSLKLILLLVFFSLNGIARVLPIEKTPALPSAIMQQLPTDYELMMFASGYLNDDKLLDYLVVVHKKGEQATFDKTREGSPRPLFIFIQNANATFTPAKRNDSVVMSIDEGGQCDPFGIDDREGDLVIKNHYFTVQNSVACGEHWEDLTTFKYDRKLKNWMFHKNSFESWSLNDSDDPNAEALISNGVSIINANPKKPILFEQYKSN